MLPVLKQRGFGAVLPRFCFSPAGEEQQLLCGFARTLGQTRSGTGDAHASWQDLPLFRTLKHSLMCCPQARLRTFPGNDVLGTRGDGNGTDRDRPPGRPHTDRAAPARCHKHTDEAAGRAAFCSIARSHGNIGTASWNVWGSRAGCRPCGAPVRLNIALNIPGARSPTLFPYCFCQPV
jgi:hypothetical protein